MLSTTAQTVISALAIVEEAGPKDTAEVKKLLQNHPVLRLQLKDLLELSVGDVLSIVQTAERLGD